MKRMMAILLMLCMLTACLPTPGTEFVVNKGDKTVEQKLSTTYDKEQHFPARWDEDAYDANEYLSISFKAEVLTKADGLYPVYRTRGAEITGEEATRWANTLLAKPESVSTLELTKADYQKALQRYVDQIEATKAWIAAGRPDDGIDRDEYIPSEEEMEETYRIYQENIDNAPAENETKPISDFTNLPQGPRHYKLTDGTDANISVYGTNYVGIAKGCVANPYVYYDYYYEEEKEDDTEDFPWPKLWQDVTMPLEDAEKLLTPALEKLGFSDYMPYRTVKANLMDSSEGGFARQVTKGWVFTLHRNPAGYPTVGVPYEPAQGMEYGGENTMANAYISPETLEIMIDETGVRYFGYSDKKEIVGVETKNVELIPWEEAQMRIRNALATCYRTDWLKENNMKAKLEVYRILLTSYTVHIPNSKEYYEMPCWVVFFDEAHYGRTTREREDMGMMQEALFINAVDGSIVHTDWGY